MLIYQSVAGSQEKSLCDFEVKTDTLYLNFCFKSLSAESLLNHKAIPIAAYYPPLTHGY